MANETWSRIAKFLGCSDAGSKLWYQVVRWYGLRSRQYPDSRDFLPMCLRAHPRHYRSGKGDGYDFVLGKNNNPRFVRPDGQIVKFNMNSRVPCLDDECLPNPSASFWNVWQIRLGRFVVASTLTCVHLQLRIPKPGMKTGIRGVWWKTFRGSIWGTCRGTVGVHSNKTEERLRAEAKSKQHVFTHRPENPYCCDVCNPSKMLRQNARKTEGSNHVIAEGFWISHCSWLCVDQETCSARNWLSELHVGHYTSIFHISLQYRYAYPAESREYEEVTKAFSHSLKPPDTSGKCHMDDGREFIEAFEELKVDHQTSIEYLDSTKSVVVREARTLMDGTRQSDTSLSIWPYAVRHHAMALNASTHVFLGYNFQVGHVWRGMYFELQSFKGCVRISKKEINGDSWCWHRWPIWPYWWWRDDILPPNGRPAPERAEADLQKMIEDRCRESVRYHGTAIPSPLLAPNIDMFEYLTLPWNAHPLSFPNFSEEDVFQLFLSGTCFIPPIPPRPNI